MGQANIKTEAGSSASAVRIDAGLGITEHAGFFGSHERIFGFRHVPGGPIRGAVLVCGSLFAEFRKNYRREVELGRILASTGVAVQRFHFRGVGNSDGDPAAVTFASLVEDALAAATQLQDATGRRLDIVVGTRLGGLVAIEVASRLSAAAVLWEPVIDPRAYLREAFRARAIADLRGAMDSERRRTPQEEMETEGKVQVLGFPIHRALYESMLAIGDDASSVATPSQALVIRRERGSGKPRTDVLIERWRRSGARVDTHDLSGEEVWWLAGREVRGSDDPSSDSDLVALTVEWLDDILGTARP